MESNSDKILRSKLSGTEFPFDPQAWVQMEAMLNEKKKRIGFFWWWLSGVAAVVLLAVSGYLISELVVSKEKIAAASSGSRQPNTGVGISEFSVVNAIAAAGSSSRNKNAIAAAVSSSNGQPNTREQIVVRNKIEKSESNAKPVANNNLKKAARNNSIAPIRVNHSNPRNQHANIFPKKKLKKIMVTQLAAKESTTGYVAAEENPFKKEVEMLNTASLEENISLSRRESSLLEYISENATTYFDKKEEDVLPKQKKKIFNYSLGILANVAGTTLGSQTFSTNERIRPLPFYKTPSYMVGFTHDFLFVNRIAITNSILFSQTSFKVYSPKTVSFSKTPTDYTSHLTELTIPIGIKIYPVVKNNFRFYINAGIINHIKLKESFDYTIPADSNFTAAVNLVDQTNFPVETNFTGAYTPSALRVPGNETSTKDFSINNAKRYYVSFYAGAGFEFIAKKHFMLFTEPMFYMSLQKIGVQDKRKYNLGLTGGFRYQF